MKEEEAKISDYLLNLMKNYSDSIIPSFSHLNPTTTTNIKQEPHFKQPSLNPSSSSRNKPRVGRPDSQKERDRRTNMNKAYAALESLLPNLTPKATRTEVVSAAIHYINQLKQVENELEARKKEVEIAARGTYTSQSSNIEVLVSGEMAFFGVYLELRRGLVARVLMAFEGMKKVEVLTANVSVDSGGIRLTVTAMVSGNGRDVAEMIKGEVLRVLTNL